MQTQARPWGEI